VTGESTTEPGGYEYVKDVIGYAPVVVGMASERKIADTLGQIYKEKGATFVVAHGDDYSLGEQRYGLFLRPDCNRAFSGAVYSLVLALTATYF
jgi:hypothetical protein